MTRPPFIPALLTAAGVIPFALCVIAPADSDLVTLFAGSNVEVATKYGIIILSFMTGIFWGFATKTDLRWPYIASVIPAIYALFFVTGTPAQQLFGLILGFTALLGFDWVFQRTGLAPAWWMTLRIPVSIAVIACLTTIWIAL